jgi:predicted O-methyltransferase YrrM
VFLQIYCTQDFLFMSTIGSYLPLDRPLTVLDAGANIGLAAVLFAQLIRFSGEVMAVDANPATCEVPTSCLALSCTL